MIGIITVYARHVINIVIFHRVYKLLNKRLIKLEAGEILCWILIGNCLVTCVPVHEIAGTLGKFADFRMML